jgi:hypothetical protein
VSANEVNELLSALRAGAMTLDEVAERFRHRSWPETRRPAPRTFLEMAEQQDAPPDVPGSYDDLTAAYDKGDISQDEYRTLVEAAAESVRAEVAEED